MTAETGAGVEARTPPAPPLDRHRHCPECGAEFPFGSARRVCNDCALAEYDEISVEAAKDHHEAVPDSDHEPEHAAEDEEGFDHEAREGTQ